MTKKMPLDGALF